MKFSSRSFSQLSTFELYQILELRARIFIVEQNCPYQDVDQLDLLAEHVLFFNEEKLCAYARIIPPNDDASVPKIGRVVVRPENRKQGLGKELMKYCVQQCAQKYDHKDIVISAQTYLLKFYHELGFIAEGDGYLEDAIPHQKMRYVF